MFRIAKYEAEIPAKKIIEEYKKKIRKYVWKN